MSECVCECVCEQVEEKYFEFFEPLLTRHKHFIPSGPDMAAIEHAITQARATPHKSATIGVAAQTFANLERVLGLAGAGLEDIFKVTIYLTDMANFPKIMELRERHFTPPYPADTIVEVRSLALPELMIEIEVMAMVPDGERRVIDG